jgi:hypothetical protein
LPMPMPLIASLPSALSQIAAGAPMGTKGDPSTKCITGRRGSPPSRPEVRFLPNGRVMSPPDHSGPFGLPRYTLCQSIAPELEHNGGPCTCWMD